MTEGLKSILSLINRRIKLGLTYTFDQIDQSTLKQSVDIIIINNDNY